MSSRGLTSLRISFCSLLCCSSAICLILYDKRFGLLQEEVNEEAMNFITAVKTVSNPFVVPLLARACPVARGQRRG